MINLARLKERVELALKPNLSGTSLHGDKRMAEWECVKSVPKLIEAIEILSAALEKNHGKEFTHGQWLANKEALSQAAKLLEEIG